MFRLLIKIKIFFRHIFDYDDECLGVVFWRNGNRTWDNCPDGTIRRLLKLHNTPK
jgi:hypothetical protein